MAGGGDPPARFVLTDEPYNVKITGNGSVMTVTGTVSNPR